MRLTIALALLGFGLSCAPSTPPQTAASAPPTGPASKPESSNLSFSRISRAFLSAFYEAYPVRATSLGIHDGDHRLTDLSQEAIERRSAALHAALGTLGQISVADLPRAESFDHAIVEHAAHAELLELEAVRSWQKNPMLYTRVIARGAATLVDREFAPLPNRIEALMSRFQAVPRVVAAAQVNLQGVPKLWAEMAVKDTLGTVSFLTEDLELALKAQGFEELDADLRARFEGAQTRAVQAVTKFAYWLEEDLLPKAEGDYRLGREVFEKKLRYEEHFALGVDELRTRNEAAIARYKEWVAKEAARIDPNANPGDVMRAITERYPSAEELIDTARRYVVQARDFVVAKDIVTLPSDALPIVRESPKYARRGFASMSTPGPFEHVAKEAYYNITNVQEDWTEAEKRQHLTYFNFPGLLGISIHEAMPGHFVQLLFEAKVPTDVRKVFSPASLIEGWAHYAEQMMVDQGLGDGDPAVRLAQLRRALQRHARWAAALDIHVDGRSIEEAARRFQEIAYFAPFPALRETQRATYNPTYLYYALGRMEILRLREDYAGRQKDAYSLKEFHDRFLTLGLPIPLARRALLEEGPKPR